VSLEPKVIWCTSLRILHACRSKISSIVSTALFKRQHPCIAPLSPNFTSPVTMSSVRSESGHIPFVFLGAWPALHPSRSRCPTTTAPPQRMESDAVVVVGHEKGEGVVHKKGETRSAPQTRTHTQHTRDKHKAPPHTGLVGFIEYIYGSTGRFRT
jgi:hypothetical protein